MVHLCTKCKLDFTYEEDLDGHMLLHEEPPTPTENEQSIANLISTFEPRFAYQYQYPYIPGMFFEQTENMQYYHQHQEEVQRWMQQQRLSAIGYPQYHINNNVDYETEQYDEQSVPFRKYDEVDNMYNVNTNNERYNRNRAEDQQHLNSNSYHQHYLGKYEIKPCENYESFQNLTDGLRLNVKSEPALEQIDSRQFSDLRDEILPRGDHTPPQREYLLQCGSL